MTKNIIIGVIRLYYDIEETKLIDDEFNNNDKYKANLKP